MQNLVTWHLLQANKEMKIEICNSRLVSGQRGGIEKYLAQKGVKGRKFQLSGV